jgi:cytoskeleton protein RodZ
MSEQLRSIGQMLREARESQGLSVEEVATRLRLMQRQVEAIEADDFASLGQPVFARGFVRNYAKLLDLQPRRCLRVWQARAPIPGS